MRKETKEKSGTLRSLGVGESASVAGISEKSEMRRRLADLGFCRGEKVECVLESPLGDPRAYFVRGAVIALRRTDAESILIRR